MNKENTYKSETSRGRHTRQIAISMDPELHEEYKSLADEIGTNFSQLCRQSIALRKQKYESGGMTRELQPLLREIEDLEEKVDDLEDLEDQISKLQKMIDGFMSSNKNDNNPINQGIDDQTIAVLDLFTPGTELGLAEICDRLTIGYEQAQRSLRTLEDSFALNRLSPEEGELQAWSWKAEGSE